MPTAIRPIGHEDRLSLVDHLDELRTRLFICVIALAIAFGICFWQNHALLKLVNRPLAKETTAQVKEGHGPLGKTELTQQAVVKLARTAQAVIASLTAPGSGLSAVTRGELAREVPELKSDVAKVHTKPEGEKPVTLGIGEPFTATLTVTLLIALIVSLPVILYELYGFVLPAFSQRERRVALPLITAIPFLFIVGVAFGYFVVLPAAIHFFSNFDSGQYEVLVQANQYYQFAFTVMLAMGLVFQVPVAILAATRVGIVTPRQLRHYRRYAVLACAAVAAFLPGDAVTLILETVPLYLLYELSILVAVIVARLDARRRRRETAESPAGPGDGGPPATGGPSAGPPPPPPPAPPPPFPRPGMVAVPDSSDLEVDRIIDHFDRELS